MLPLFAWVLKRHPKETTSLKFPNVERHPPAKGDRPLPLVMPREPTSKRQSRHGNWPMLSHSVLPHQAIQQCTVFLFVWTPLFAVRNNQQKAPFFPWKSTGCLGLLLSWLGNSAGSLKLEVPPDTPGIDLAQSQESHGT